MTTEEKNELEAKYYLYKDGECHWGINLRHNNEFGIAVKKELITGLNEQQLRDLYIKLVQDKADAIKAAEAKEESYKAKAKANK